ncbi:helix-turn-helix domain-containing protein [Delftia tsuruhatensis]|uniref:HTH cro/C1-type domain-containing protein n=1 Tax=Delftia tsuruhatensis TaxID=180282 RepID=A0ABN4SVS7_9BURK|nr:helix-turn-helix transcriptional regulator [Delftia tsuruhatensis]AOV05719.1 hypothetical protein BI380_32615 [Delftia tsuruhatensis]
MTAKPPSEHTAGEIATWMARNGLTQTAAAEALGISRRMLLYYLTGEKPVPRTVALACLGWEVERANAA